MLLGEFADGKEKTKLHYISRRGAKTQRRSKTLIYLSFAEIKTAAKTIK